MKCSNTSLHQHFPWVPWWSNLCSVVPCKLPMLLQNIKGNLCILWIAGLLSGLWSFRVNKYYPNSWLNPMISNLYLVVLPKLCMCHVRMKTGNYVSTHSGIALRAVNSDCGSFQENVLNVWSISWKTDFVGVCPYSWWIWKCVFCELHQRC